MTLDELLEASPTIVRARVEGFLPGVHAGDWIEAFETNRCMATNSDCMRQYHLQIGVGSILVDYGSVELRVVEVLKGVSVPGARIYTYGQVDDPRDPVERSAEAPYRWRGNGSCVADDYRRGAEYVLFARDGELVHAFLMPINSEVDGPDDPWVAWIRERLGLGAGAGVAKPR